MKGLILTFKEQNPIREEQIAYVSQCGVKHIPLEDALALVELCNFTNYYFHLSVQEYIHQFHLNKSKSLLKFADAFLNSILLLNSFQKTIS